MDWIGIQGIEAGGHRASLYGIDDENAELKILTFLRKALALTRKPIIAAGGIGQSQEILALLRSGATAVQVGTRFLTTAEAGTKVTHRESLLRDSSSRGTEITQAFSGKSARGLTNDFIEKTRGKAPNLYPYLHFLTAAFRAKANEQCDGEYLNLWAGTGYEHCRDETVVDVLKDLFPYEVTDGNEWTLPGSLSSELSDADLNGSRMPSEDLK